MEAAALDALVGSLLKWAAMWLGSMFAAGLVTADKGRGFFEGFIIAIVLGPYALIATLGYVTGEELEARRAKQRAAGRRS